MKALIKEDCENDTISNPENIERADGWKMLSPQSSNEQQEVEEIHSDGDSDEITFLCSKIPEDPLDTNENSAKPEKEIISRKRKTKSKVSYDENFTDESDDDNLHLHLDSESDLEKRTSNVNKRKKYKKSSDVSHVSSDSDIEIINKKINKNEHATFVQSSGKRPMTNSEKEPVKKLKKSGNATGTEKDIHLQEFWGKSDVAEIFLSVKNEDMTIETASEILGFSHSYTNQRYNEIVLNGTDEGELYKPWFISKRYVRQYVNSSSGEPGKCSDNEGKTSYKNGNKFSNTSKSESVLNNNTISEISFLPGWKRQVQVRQNGSTAGKTDVYYISPKGKKIRSIPTLISYCCNEEIDVDFSKFDFNGKSKIRRNKRPRKNIKYETNDSELSETKSFQTKKSIENRLNDNLLLIRYNIRKCIKIILEDCVKSKPSLSSEIKKTTMPHAMNEASQEENNLVRKSTFGESFDNFLLKSESQDATILDNGEEMASRSNAIDIKTEDRPESQNGTLSGNGEENTSRSSAVVIKTEDRPEPQNATLSDNGEEKASRSNAIEIKTEDRPEPQNATLSDNGEEKASRSNAIEIKTEDRPELGRLRTSSSENDKTSEFNLINKDSNSDSGSQSDVGNSSEREEKLVIAFSLDNFPCQEQLSILADALDMRVARVKRWFMNKRIAMIESMILQEDADVIDKGMLNYKKHLLPYQCKKCKAAFVSLKDCRNHKKEHHWTDKEYTCKQCDKIFTITAEYDEHKENGQCKPKFTILDIVWAKFNVYPWWPAIVCKHPNTEAYLRRNQIHVQFFDKPVSRGWVDHKFVKAFGPVGKCGIPLCSDKKWVTSVIDAQRAVMMPKMSRSKLLVTMTPTDDESDWRPPEGELKTSGKSSENDNNTERLYNSKKKRSDRTEGSKNVYRSKKRRNYQSENSDSGSSSPDDYYLKRHRDKMKKKYLKKIKREREYEKRVYEKREYEKREYEKINSYNAKTGFERVSRRKKMIMEEHFSHNHLIPFEVQNDLAKELELSQKTIGNYLRTFRTQIFSEVKKNKEERGVFSCNLCPVKYLSKLCLTNHMELHHPGRGLKCSDCSTAFEYPSVYYHHLRFKGHNASREVDEYLKELSEHTISVKDLIRDLDYIFTDEYKQKSSKLDLTKIVDAVYKLKCQPGEECQCDADYSDSVPRYIQDMFQGMDSNDDFIIVDDDDLIYMGKSNSDKLLPMIIKTGAKMLAASDVPYKKFYYKFKQPTDIKHWKGPHDTSTPAVPTEAFHNPIFMDEKTISQVSTETSPRLFSETPFQNVPTRPAIPKVPAEALSSVVPVETTTPAVVPEKITQALNHSDTTIAILPNKTSSTSPVETSIPSVPAEIKKTALVPVETTTSEVFHKTSALAVPTETTKSILPANLTTPTILPDPTIQTGTSKTTKPEVVPIETNQPIYTTNTFSSTVPTWKTKYIVSSENTISTVSTWKTKYIVSSDNTILTVPADTTTPNIPTETTIPIVSSNTIMPLVTSQTTTSTMNNISGESSERTTLLSNDTIASAGTEESCKTLFTQSATDVQPSTYFQHTTGKS